MPNILLITNAPTPYRIPFFNEIDQKLRQIGFKLTVVFAVDQYQRRRWQLQLDDCNFGFIVLAGKLFRAKNTENPVFTFPKLTALCRDLDPAAIICSEYSIGTMKVWLRSFFKNTPYIVWSGHIRLPGQRLPFYRRLQRRLILRRATACVAYGSAAKEMFESLGADPIAVFVAINTVDTDFFKRRTTLLRQRTDQSSSTLFRFLYVGYLTKGKRLDLLFEAAQKLLARTAAFQIDIVGDGPERHRLFEYSTRLGIDKNVIFHGYKQKEELPRYLANADSFVFPSEYDIWGLVLVEAMASGLVCLASIKCGATQDLFPDDTTGYATDFTDPAVVADKMRYLIENPDVATTIGLRAQKYVEERVNLDVSAQGMVTAIARCTQH